MALTYEPIATTTLGSAASSVTFSSIPSTYTDLIIVSSAKATTSASATYGQFNNDTATNYSNTSVSGNGTSASSTRGNNQPQINIGAVETTNFALSLYQIMNYANTTTFKTIIGRRGASSTLNVAAEVGLWRKTPEAINEIKIFLIGDTFTSGSTFTLYGIKAA